MCSCVGKYGLPGRGRPHADIQLAPYVQAVAIHQTPDFSLADPVDVSLDGMLQAG